MRFRILPFVVTLLFLTACATASQNYTEIRLSPLSDFTYQGEEQAFANSKFLAKQGKEQKKKIVPQASDTIHVYQNNALCRKYIATATNGGCVEYSGSGKRYTAVRTGAYKSGIEEWSFFEDNNVLFKAPMVYGAEEPIKKVEIVDGKPAVTFVRGLKPSPSENELAEATDDVFYNGKMVNEQYAVEGSQGLFSFNGVLGFVGKKEGKEYIFFNGKTVSKAFDAIRTEACCAVPATTLKVFDNGALVFTGERDGYGYLTETVLRSASDK